jgi:CubicO group peptidase (beta-lactamase class C family)
VPNLPHDLAPPSLGHVDWPRGDANAIAPLPAAQKAALDTLAAKAFDGSTYGKGSKTSSVLVLLDGRIVAERYALGVTMHTPQRTWSMAKSLVATLIDARSNWDASRFRCPPTFRNGAIPAIRVPPSQSINCCG